ncbi:hypothetical protein M0813_07197 [Anaeramoeba flamelloides]|uniref:Uncharacterized protein n=1 Tax=Anaeramoeba flamelloides TaxID=1746091 RepID=A0ABQ8XBC2_9EUKA|nr:hypothetical protein M0813_07197 [Anaeramoeba flamelloides]
MFETLEETNKNQQQKEINTKIEKERVDKKKKKKKNKKKKKPKPKTKIKKKEKDQHLSVFLRSKRIFREKGHQYLTKALETLNKPSNTNEILDQIKVLFPALWEGYLDYFKTKKDADRSLRIFVVENPINTMKVSRKRWTKKARPTKNFDFNKHFYFEQSIGSERRCKIGLKKWLKSKQSFLNPKNNPGNEEITLDYNLPQKMIGTSFFISTKEKKIIQEFLILDGNFEHQEPKRKFDLSAFEKRLKNKNLGKFKMGNINESQSIKEANLSGGISNDNNNCHLNHNHLNIHNISDQVVKSVGNDYKQYNNDEKYGESQCLNRESLERKRHFNLNLNEMDDSFNFDDMDTIQYYYHNSDTTLNKQQKRRRTLPRNNYKALNYKHSNIEYKQIISEIIGNYSENYENVLFELQTQKISKLKLAEKLIEMNIPHNILSTVLKRVGCGDKIVIMLINKYSENKIEKKEQIINALISYVIKFF